MIYVILFGTTVAIAVAVHWLLSSPKGEEPHACHFRCRGCSQKLRYRAGFEGRKVICPSCLRPCIIPRAGETLVSVEVEPQETFRVRRL